MLSDGSSMVVVLFVSPVMAMLTLAAIALSDSIVTSDGAWGFAGANSSSSGFGTCDAWGTTPA